MYSASFRVFRCLRSGMQRKPKDPKVRRILIVSATLALGILTAFSAPADTSWAERSLKSLSLRDKIAQLVQIRVPGKFLNRGGDDFRAIQKDIRQNRVGGVVLFAGNIYESAFLLNELQGISLLPLLVAADFERGAAFRITDTTSFPWTMAVGASGSEQLAYRQGEATAREARALGVHWIFAPVMDVNNNPNNPVINIRSFGEDPDLVARLGAAFIRGAKSCNVLTTAKHFPGHGDTETDSHLNMAVVPSDLSRLQSVELLPFRGAIEAGVDSIMTAHVSVPNVTEEPQVPATLSSKVLTDLLRETLQFKGLVVTDALEMGGITNRYWGGQAAVLAIQAGADILLLPPNATVVITEVERAVQRGDISESRINESVRKILAVKSRLNLHKERTVSIRRIADIIASPEHTKLAQDMADQSVTALKDDQRLLPIDPTRYDRIYSIVMTPDLESSPASVFQAEMRQRFPLTRTAWLNARIPDQIMASVDKAVSEADLIVCSTWSRLASGRAADAIPDAQLDILKKLQAAQKPLIWVVFGNPYILPFAPKIDTVLCTFSNSDVSQIAAAKALSGEIGISGKMPVSITGFSKAGDGRNIPKLEMVLKPAIPASPELVENRFEKISRLLDSYVRNGVFPGAALLVGHQGRIFLNHASGRTDYADDSPKASPDAVYSSADFSIPVAVASAAMIAADEGSLLLDSPVKDYLPELGNTEYGKLALATVLRPNTNRDEEGTRFEEEILRSVLTRTAGIPMEQFVAERLFKPLGMKSTSYKPPPNSRRGANLSLGRPIPVLFGSARDFAVFAQMLLNRGIYSHRRYFRIETVDKFTGSRGAWSKPLESGWTGRIFSSNAFGYFSDSGSLIWIDPARKLFVVLMANGRPGDGRIPEAQRDICESVISGLQD